MGEKRTSVLVEPAKSRFFYGYIVVLAASFVMLTASGGSQIFSVFFKPLLVDFGWTRAATAGAYFLNSVLSGALRAVAGKLNDRFGPRLVISCCSLFSGLSYLLMSQVQDIWQLYLFYGVVLGVGMSGDVVPVLSTVARWFIKKRGIVTGIVTSTSSLSQAIIPLIVSRFIVAYGWRASYIIVALITLVPTIVAAQFLRRDPTQMGQLPYGASAVEAEDITLEVKNVPLGGAVRSGQFWLFSAIIAISAVGMGVFMVHIVAYATDLGMSVTSAANILAFFGGTGIAGKIIMGSAVDRIGTKTGMIIVLILDSSALFILIWATEAWMFYLSGAILGFGLGGFIPVHSLVIADLFGLSSHGMLLGLTMVSVTVGLGIGSFMAGEIFDITGSYTLAFIIAAMSVFIALLLTLLLKTTRKIAEENSA